jgi:ribonuclease VapC
VNLFDASALLCFLQGEKGADLVEAQLVGSSEGEARCSAANWSEVVQKVKSRDRDWQLAVALLMSYGIVVEPVTRLDAERAAELWSPGSGLSLADRLCLATGDRLDALVWTADSEWAQTDRIRQVR